MENFKKPWFHTGLVKLVGIEINRDENSDKYCYEYNDFKNKVIIFA